MASIGHVVVGLAGARLLCTASTPRRDRYLCMALLSALSLLPDADVIAFGLRIPYAAEWGHRGASHSLALAVVVGGLAGWLLSRFIPASPGRLGRALAISIAVLASHGLLDALTDGGLGAALLWPGTPQRYFFPLRPLPVAPIGLHLLSQRGLSVLLRETLYFLPLLVWSLWPRRT